MFAWFFYTIKFSLIAKGRSTALKKKRFELVFTVPFWISLNCFQEKFFCLLLVPQVKISHSNVKIAVGVITPSGNKRFCHINNLFVCFNFLRNKHIAIVFEPAFKKLIPDVSRFFVLLKSPLILS